VIFVGDKGLVSNKVLEKLEELGCGYVIAARVKKLPESIRNEITKEHGWKPLNDDLSIKELQVKDRRLVVYKSKSLKEEEEKRRQELLEWLKEQILNNPKKLLLRNRYSKYLEVEAGEVKLNLRQIEKEKQLDGVFGFWCSKEGIKAEALVKKIVSVVQGLHFQTSFRILLLVCVKQKPPCSMAYATYPNAVP
jgi:hypothetical protein